MPEVTNGSLGAVNNAVRSAFATFVSYYYFVLAMVARCGYKQWNKYGARLQLRDTTVYQFDR